jgi:hypothetical protein
MTACLSSRESKHAPRHRNELTLALHSLDELLLLEGDAVEVLAAGAGAAAGAASFEGAELDSDFDSLELEPELPPSSFFALGLVDE